VYFQDTLSDDPVILDDVDTLVLSLGHRAADELEQELGIKVQVVDTDQGAEHLIKMIID
jgi:hypothetical protein